MRDGRCMIVIDRIVQRLRALLPGADAAQPELLAQQCAEEFLLACGLETLPEGAETVIVQMACFKYTHLGAEGLTGMTGSGMSESYRDDYPEPLKRAMHRFRRVKSL